MTLERNHRPFSLGMEKGVSFHFSITIFRNFRTKISKATPLSPQTHIGPKKGDRPPPLVGRRKQDPPGNALAPKIQALNNIEAS